MKKPLIMLAFAMLLCSCTSYAKNGKENNTYQPSGDFIFDSGNVSDDTSKTNDLDSQYLLLDDEVTYSLYRLDNADFSFNFAMGATPHPKRKISLDIDPSQLSRTTSWDFFGSITSQLNEIRNSVLEMVDYCVENITVDNVVVYNNMYSFVLEYDNNNDVITLYQNDLANSEAHGMKIKLFYYNEGYETVHVVSGGVGSNVEVIYSPNHYYYYFIHYYEFDDCVLNIAYHSEDGWVGLSSSFNKNLYLFNEREGEVPADISQLGIQYIIERDGELFQLDEAFCLNRNGMNIMPGNMMFPTDTLVSSLGMFSWGSQCYYRLNGCDLSLGLAFINGVKNVHYEISDRDEQHLAYQQRVTFSSREDYVELDNGLRLCYGDGWSPRYGLFKKITGETERDTIYYDSNENVIDTAEFLNSGPYVSFAGVYTSVNNGEIQKESATINFVAMEGKQGCRSVNDGLYVLRQFFALYGLEIVTIDNSNAFDLICNFYHNITSFKTEAMLRLLNIQDDPDIVLAHFKSCITTLDETITHEIHDQIAAIPERISFNDLPKANSSSVMISPASFNGRISISNNGLVLNDIQVAFPKTVVLRQGASYSLVLRHGNTTISDSLFNVVTYQGEAITFSLKSGNTMPLLDNPNQGTLNLVLVKVTNNSAVQISKPIIVPIVNFDSFTVQKASPIYSGGYDEFSYSTINNSLTIEKYFVDISAPIVSTSLSQTSEGQTLIPRNATINHFLDTLRILDNYDTSVSSKDALVEVMSAPEGMTIEDVGVSLLDRFVDGAVYRFSIKDSAGNVGSLVIAAKLYKISSPLTFAYELNAGEEISFDDIKTCLDYLCYKQYLFYLSDLEFIGRIDENGELDMAFVSLTKLTPGEYSFKYYDNVFSEEVIVQLVVTKQNENISN